MNKTVLTLLGSIIAILLLVSGYFIYQNQKLAGKLLSPSPVATTVTQTIGQVQNSPQPPPSPSASSKRTLKEVQQNIEAAVNSKNYQALVGYIQTPRVNFIIMSSSCCEPQTPDEAATQLAYVKDGTPFDFNQNTTLVKNLKSNNVRLTNAYIGISQTNEQLVGFTLDTDNQIMQIEVSVSHKLYTQ